MYHLPRHKVVYWIAYGGVVKEPHYPLAQVSIARARAQLQGPVMAGFVEQLPVINALADASPGCVWSLQSETGDNTYRGGDSL